MVRTVLQELDSLDHILSDACYRVDRDKLESDGIVTIDKNNDRLRLKVNTIIDRLNDNCSVELEEDCHLGVNASLLEKVTIKALHRETLALKPDHFVVQHFKGGTYNKACDYLILTRFNNENYALFIDLKTSIGRAPNNGKLDFHGSDYDASMIWQMIGADNIFDGLTSVVYKNVTYQRGGIVDRTHSHVFDLKKCAKTPLAKYKRRYIILYMKVSPHTNATNGGIQMTNVRFPHDECLEREVCVLQVSNGDSLEIGELISCAGL